MARIHNIPAFLALAACGCSGVYPTYSATPAEAAYDLRSDGASFGSARVTAAAVEDRDVDGTSRAVVSVEVLVDNTGSNELRIDAKEVALTYVRTRAAVIDGKTVDVLSRKVSEAGDGVARVEASFALPYGYAAREVVRFGLVWSFVRDGEVFDEVTSFYVPSPAAVPLVSGYEPTLVLGSQIDIYSGYAGPAAGLLPESGVYIAPPPVYLSPQPAMPSWHMPAQPSISSEHAPAQPTLGGRSR